MTRDGLGLSTLGLPVRLEWAVLRRGRLSGLSRAAWRRPDYPNKVARDFRYLHFAGRPSLVLSATDLQSCAKARA